MTQLGLLDRVEQIEKPHKRVRGVSVEGYRRINTKPEKGESQAEARRQLCLRKLAAYRNLYQRWPTAAELVDWVAGLGELERNDPNTLRPRVTELVDLGVCAYTGKRKCAVTNQTARTVIILEVGAERGR